MISHVSRNAAAILSKQNVASVALRFLVILPTNLHKHKKAFARRGLQDTNGLVRVALLGNDDCSSCLRKLQRSNRTRRAQSSICQPHELLLTPTTMQQLLREIS